MSQQYKNKRVAKQGDRVVDLRKGIAGKLGVINQTIGFNNSTIIQEDVTSVVDCLCLEDLAKATIPDYSGSPYGAYR